MNIIDSIWAVLLKPSFLRGLGHVAIREIAGHDDLADQYGEAHASGEDYIVATLKHFKKPSQ